MSDRVSIRNRQIDAEFAALNPGHPLTKKWLAQQQPPVATVTVAAVAVAAEPPPRKSLPVFCAHLGDKVEAANCNCPSKHSYRCRAGYGVDSGDSRGSHVVPARDCDADCPGWKPLP